MVAEVKKPEIKQDASPGSAQTEADARTIPENPTPDLSRKAFEQVEAKPWNSTPQGRLAIRAFTRGILGAAAFTWGGYYASRGKGYAGESLGLDGYDHYAGAAGFNKGKPLHYVAKFFDVVAGTPIKYTVTNVANALGHDGKYWGEGSVLFRPTNKARSVNTKGRSLGEEVVGVTFDFFTMSIADAFGRDMVDWFDPNVKKNWIDNKGNIKPAEMADNIVKRSWRYLSYNGGEDWAVALPYVYLMKAQRSLIHQFSPGWKYDFDRSLNGGSHKINEHSQHIGNYNLEGILDLQSRFTCYNIGTLMYREWYNNIANKLNGKPDSLYGSPDKPPADLSVAGSVEHTAKWMMRSVIKGVITMTPAVPFFWITRTPQHKYKGALLHQGDNSMLSYIDNEGKPSAVRSNEFQRHDHKPNQFNDKTPTYLAKYSTATRDWETTHVSAPNPFAQNGDFHSRTHRSAAYERVFNPVDSVLNAFGTASNSGRKAMHHVPKLFGYNAQNLSSKSFHNYKKISDRFFNASVSYYPYMYVKAETAKLWDTGKMDMSAERLVDGLFSGNWKEVKAGAGEVVNTILQNPLEPEREAEGQRRNDIDNSAADSFNDSQGSNVSEQVGKFRDKVKPRPATDTKPTADAPWYAQPRTQKTPAEQIPWENRVFSGPKPENFTGTVDKKTSYTEREKLDRVLKEAQPYNNLIH